MIEGTPVNTHQDFYPQIRVTSTVTQARFGLDWETVGRIADRHTLTVQSWLSSRSPRGQRFEGRGVIATSTGIGESGLNLVLNSHFPADAGETVIEADIEAVISFFKGRNAPFLWWLSPFANPQDMTHRLMQRGFEPLPYALPTMVAPLTSPAPWPTYNPTIQVWPARSRADLEAASLIRRIAFRFAPDSALTYFEDMAEDWLRGNPARLYLARLGTEGPPMAIGALIMGQEWPGVYVMATLPQAERQGLAKAVLHHILSEAKAEGHEMIILTAGARAYSLYRKFGFEHIFEYGLYQLQENNGRL